ESFQNFEKTDSDDAWLESFANLAKSTSKVRWLKSSFESLWQKHVHELAQRPSFERGEHTWPESAFTKRDDELLKIAEQRGWIKVALKVAGFPLDLKEIEKAKPVFTNERIKSWLSIVPTPVLIAFFDYEPDENRLGRVTFWARKHRDSDLLSWATKRTQDLFQSYKPKQSKLELALKDRFALSLVIELDLDSATKYFETLSPGLRKSLGEQVSFAFSLGRNSLAARKLRWELLGG
ncbi:MAG: hypothetical protein P1V97_38230, partial [Planctomycetota bacterium]|nr:hypothetical protein [Planctomycetota bacterium]